MGNNDWISSLISAIGQTVNTAIETYGRGDGPGGSQASPPVTTPAAVDHPANFTTGAIVLALVGGVIGGGALYLLNRRS